VRRDVDGEGASGWSENECEKIGDRKREEKGGKRKEERVWALERPPAG
jgi:hypothetical protein